MIISKDDPDYKDNQSRAQQLWNKKNPDYWNKYRRSHPKYTERNQVLQKNVLKCHLRI